MNRPRIGIWKRAPGTARAGQAEHLAGATSRHLAGAGGCWSSRRPCWDWEHAAVSGAPPPSLQPAARGRQICPRHMRPMHPSVLAAPDQCIAISGLPYSENDARPKKCCPGTPAVSAKSPLFFNRLRGRQACIRWIVSSSIKPYLETGTRVHTE